MEEGEVLLQKGIKQQKTAKDKRNPSAKSREDLSGVEVCTQQRTWAPRLEIDGAAIPWNTFIKEFQRGALCLHCQGTGIAPPPAQGYGGPQAHEVARPFHVPEKGPCHGKLTIVSLFIYLLLLLFFFYMGFLCHFCAGCLKFL